MCNARIVLCSGCGSEGRIYQAWGNDPDPVDTGPCPWCEGTGGEIIETLPIELSDLDAISACPDCGQSLPLLYPCLQQGCPS